jgi:hypothetical protein
MLRAYNYIDTTHLRLHEYVIAFFNRIEFQTGDFTDVFFETEFLPIVNRHKKILRDEFLKIYNEVKDWDQLGRSILCQQIRQSNEIERICAREVIPVKLDREATGLYETIRTLFLKLYSNVLDGNIFREEMKLTLREHFDEFRQSNQAITLCPMCGITQLKTEHDDTRDQYDHYLPKALFPYSAVNFLNLVPTCKDCNLDVKKEKDVLLISGNRKIFFPFARNHSGVDISISIAHDLANISHVVWNVELVSRDGKDEEVESWNMIYEIDFRYKSFIKGRIRKWYEAYWKTIRTPMFSRLSDEDKFDCYIEVLKGIEEVELDVIQRPALQAFIEQSPLARAAQEAALYS